MLYLLACFCNQDAENKLWPWELVKQVAHSIRRQRFNLVTEDVCNMQPAPRCLRHLGYPDHEHCAAEGLRSASMPAVEARWTPGVGLLADQAVGKLQVHARIAQSCVSRR
jgi:hypothetical protein